MTDLRPRVGLGVIIVNDRGEILLGERLAPHGRSSWGPPGGHLEQGESFEACALRETREETGIVLESASFAGVGNDVFTESGKHYVTIYMLARLPKGQTAVNCEPEKTGDWVWFAPDALPAPLFLPFQKLVAGTVYGTGLDIFSGRVLSAA